MAWFHPASFTSAKGSSYLNAICDPPNHSQLANSGSSSKPFRWRGGEVERYGCNFFGISNSGDELIYIHKAVSRKSLKNPWGLYYGDGTGMMEWLT